MTLFNNPYTHSFDGKHKEQVGTNGSFLNRITEPWEENKVTLNNQPSITTKGQIQITHLSYEYANVSISVTNMVNDMVKNPSTNFGFMLTLVDESPYKSLVFASSDLADSSKWPQLDLEYSILDSKNLTGNESSTFNVFPNPILEELTVSIENVKNEKLDLKVYDELGKLVFEQTLENQSQTLINTAAWSSGVYTMNVISENGLTFHRKLVKI